MLKKHISYTILCTSLFLSACGGGGSASSPTTQPPVVTPPVVENPQETSAEVIATQSLSQHFVEFIFDKSVTSDSLSASDIELVSGSGQKLAVLGLSFYADGKGAVLQTGAQDPVLYSILVNSQGASSQHKAMSADNKGSVKVGPTITFTNADNFIGSTGPEPFVLSVTAMTNTSVLITMDRDIDESTAKLVTAYRILAPNEGVPNVEEGRVEVLTATVDNKDPRRITLTTTPMTNIQYVLTISNIITKAGGKLIHPDRNGGYFFGIAATDVTAPLLLSAVSTSHNSVIATFNEPLWDTAADPAHYRICSIAFNNQGVCPEINQLSVISSELVSQNTQVTIITGPQDSGVSYYLSVKDVTDRASPAPGNIIAASTVAKFIGSGLSAPDIASSIATDNTHVLITFTERMDPDALNYANYRIENPSLDIINAVFGDDQWHVILTTSPQQRIDYQLVASSIHSAEGLLMVNPPIPSLFVGFDAKDTQKPYLIASIAETSNRVRLYFSEPMDTAAATPEFYAVTFCPEFQTCSVNTLSSLPVLSAQLVESNTQVILTVENIAPRVPHKVVVSSSVTDQAMPLPHNSIDSALNTGTFGLLLADKTAPGVANLTFTSTNSITLTFSEEVNEGAANPLYYRVCSQPFDANGTCANGNIQVLGAVLNSSHTQVALTTQTLVDGTTYYVQITDGVTDTSGNIILSSANSIDAYYEGATSVSDPSKLPQVVGAISTGNTGVTVSFSSVMGDSALLPGNYVFTQENVNSEVGTVFTMSVSWFDATHTAVNIKTTSQNEVTYRATVVNVKDKQGNPLATQDGTINPNYDPRSAVFPGSPPVAQNLLLTIGNFQLIDNDDNGEIDGGDTVIIDGNALVLMDINQDGSVDNWVDANDNGLIDAGDSVSGLVDSDSDGLADNEELRGTTVMIELINGETILREVTSDPTSKDTDQDGLTDGEEWAFGMDPRSPDTDADGLSDYIEWNVIYSAPADQDTDGDSLPDGAEHTFFLTSPLLADTDGDQFTDDEELTSLNRDPKVADMPALDIKVDGINLKIDERYTYVNSDGQTVSSESSTSASLSNSQNTSFANSTTTFSENVSSFSWDVGFGIRDAQTDDAAVNGNEATLFTSYLTSLFDRLFVEVGLSGSSESRTGTNTQIDSASAREAQQALENSLVKFNEQAKGQEVTRELTAARISANIIVQNKGDVAFTVKNLEISVLQVDPQNPSRYLPIATLIADSTLITGNDLEVNIGPFDGSKGPFVFANNDVYPSVIEALMRDPKSLVFKVVNYDIADEYERNFAFSSQLVHDRTVGISFDFGELGNENYQVASNGVLNNKVYLGGFDDKGKTKGLPLGYLLESVLGLAKHDTTKDYIDAGGDGVLNSIVTADDVLVGNRITTGANGVLDSALALGDLRLNDSVHTGIIAGVNKKVDTHAQGDDVQLVPYGTTGVAPRTLVIDPGNNGVLDSIQSDGDEQEFVSGYELKRTCSIASADATLVGRYCSVDTNDCSCNGPSGLVRVNTFRNGDYGANWFVRVEGDMPTSVDFDKITLKAGQSIRLAFLQDLDKDGLFAHEEFLFGSTDSSVDIYKNDEFVPKVINGRYLKKSLGDYTDVGIGDGLPDSMDSDRDGISDLVEAKLGWLISRNGELKRVFSSPATADSDNDGLWDIQEQDLREFCKPNDPRSDSLCISQPVSQADASAIIVGKNGKLDTLVSGDDVYAFVTLVDDNNDGIPDENSFNRNLMFATVGILPGDNGVIDTVIGPLDEYSNSSLVLPATDPLLSDTDADRVNDGDELFGFAAGMSIIETSETECNYTVVGANKVCDSSGIRWGLVETVAQGDDVQRIFLGSRTQIGDVIITAGPNGILETEPQGNDATVPEWYLAAGPDRQLNSINLGTYNYESNPAPGSNIVVYATNNFVLDPYAPAVWNSTGTPVGLDPTKYVEPWLPVASGKDIKLYGHIVTTDPLRQDTDRDSIPDGFEVAIGADPTVDDSEQFKDSDFDGLSDMQEARGWIVSVNNALGVLVRPSSVVADSDYDGLPDYVERDIGSNPNNSDTDNDGLDDYEEFRTVTRETMAGTKINFSVYDYAKIAQLFTGFNLVINPNAINSDPVLSDTDGDLLSDYAEVVTGYKVTLVGELYPGELILTDPNNADSDGDKITDYDEARGVWGATTDATNVDTDGDGTTDYTETRPNSLTNPLQQDALVTVNYESLYLANLDSCAIGGEKIDDQGNSIPCPSTTNVLWWLYANGDDGIEKGNHLVSSSDEFAYTPEGTVRPTAAGHYSLVSSDATIGLSPAEIPSTAASVYGLRQQAKECPHDTLREELDCQDNFDVELGDPGFSSNANIFFGPGGFTGLWDNFVVTWSGDIYIPATGDYSFYIVSDDGVRLTIDTTEQVLTMLDGATATDDQIWGDHGAQEASGELKSLTEGWHTIKLKLYDQGGPSGISFRWTTPSDATKQIIPEVNFRHPLGNGSFACIGIERDPTRSSFISLNREIELNNTFAPVDAFLPDQPYYGSVQGSELRLFRDIVALDTDVNYPPNSRLFLEPAAGKTTQDLVAMALDLAASRQIIDKLVRPDAQNQSVTASALIKYAGGKRFYELSKAGRMLYQQLKNQQLYGQQSFVVRKGENLQLSGILMKVDDQESLTSCPIGSAGAVSQFESGCTKRFSRTVSFAEISQQSYTTFDLNSLLTDTYTSDGNPAGCEIELNVILSR
jgi:hypothetical protein